MTPIGVTFLVVLAPQTSTNAGDGRSVKLALSRRDVFIWVSAIVFLNQLFSLIKDAPSTSPEQLFSDLSSVGIFQLMAWIAIFRLLASADACAVAQWKDFLAGIALCCLIFPSPRMIWVTALGIAIYGWLNNGGDLKLRAASIVLAALSVQEFWGKIVFKLFELPLLRAETAVVGSILEAVRPGIAWQDNVITGPDGHGIVVYDLCSSFHNLSVAALCWMTVRSQQDRNWQTRDFVTGGVVCLTMVLFNVTRLCLMAWSADLYEYWHYGPGFQIFAVGASVAMLLISLYGSRANWFAT